MQPPPGMEVFKRLGAGSEATVFSARDITMNRLVALKRVALPGTAVAARQDALAEGRILAGLNHPNIARVYDVALTPDAIWLVMEFVAGRPIQAYLRSGAAIDPAISLRWASQLAGAVGYLGSRQVVHQDLKPANVVVDANSNCRLVDFGIALRAGSATSGRGTPAFMSPEQITGQAPISGATDVYALGVLLFWLLAGEHPYQSARGSLESLARAHLTAEPPELGSYQSGFSRRFRKCLRQSLAKEPTARPSPEQLRSMIDRELGRLR